MGNAERIRGIALRVAGQYRQGWGRTAIVVSAMAGETNRLVELVRQVNPQATAKSYDVAVAAGEQVSVGLLAAALEAEGVETEPLLGYQLGIRTGPHHANARIHSIDITKIRAAFEKGRIPVIAGFQGVSPEMAITTLGRGGSDTSAVALAIALEAEFCEINTDVSGVFTADPRVVAGAKLIETLSYQAAMELALLGSKVLHVRSVELGAKYKMPIVVRSTFEADEARRTKIVSYSESEGLEAPVVSGITMEKNIAKVSIRGIEADPSAISDIFSRVAARGVNVDIIVHDRRTSNELSVGFTVPESDLETALGAINGLTMAGTPPTIETKSGLAKVSAVGLGMQTHSGVASRAFGALGKEKIDILMISTSEIKISCVVPGSQADAATRCLHRVFFGD